MLDFRADQSCIWDRLTLHGCRCEYVQSHRFSRGMLRQQGLLAVPVESAACLAVIFCGSGAARMGDDIRSARNTSLESAFYRRLNQDARARCSATTEARLIRSHLWCLRVTHTNQNLKTSLLLPEWLPEQRPESNSYTYGLFLIFSIHLEISTGLRRRWMWSTMFV